MDKRDIKQMTKVFPNEIIFVLVGNIPPKKNSKRIFHNRTTNKPFIVSSENYLKWERTAQMQLKTQMVGNIFPLKGIESICVTIYYGDLRLKDNTNTVESVHDLLVKCGVIIDDNWRCLPDTRQIAEYRKDNAGCVISIRLPI